MQTDRCVGVGLVLEQHGDTVPERVAQRLVVRRHEPARSAQVALANVVEHILEGRVGLDAGLPAAHSAERSLPQR